MSCKPHHLATVLLMLLGGFALEGGIRPLRADEILNEAAEEEDDGFEEADEDHDADSVPGLLATCSDGRRRITIVTATPNCLLAADQSIHPALGTAFEAVWEGTLSVVQPGQYTFQAGDAELFVREQRVCGPGESGAISLDAGQHPLRLVLKRKQGPVRVRLQWQSEHFPIEPVPSWALAHAKEDAAPASDSLIEQGRLLVEEYGCVNCHKTDSTSLKGRSGPHLSGIGSRVRAGWIESWLANPRKFRRHAAMPGMLEEAEQRDVAAYLASLQAADGLSAHQSGPPISSFDVSQGEQLFGKIGCAACHAEPGLELVGLGSKTTVPALAAYLKDPAHFDPSGRMPSMLLSDSEARQLAAYLVQSRNEQFEQPLAAGDAVRGKQSVQQRGCLACHQLEDPEPLANQQALTRLAQLQPERGCLAQPPAAGLPRYELSDEERSAVQAFLNSYRESPDVSPAPVYDFHRRVKQLRCVACHRYDERGPTASQFKAVPPLTFAGEKLRSSWMTKVLSDKKRMRDWLPLRMPDFAASAVEPLVPGFALAAGIEPGAGPPPETASPEAAASGVRLLGQRTGGLSCIACHDLRDFRPGTLSGPDMSEIPQRLRYDWFARFMHDPQRILPGTSMPNTLATVRPEQQASTIHQLWAALEMGDEMPLPPGAEAPRATYEPLTRPRMHRIFVPDSGPASICVGLPEGRAYCWDAGPCQLRYVWKGGYLATWEHWKGNGNVVARPLGRIYHRERVRLPLRIGYDPTHEPSVKFRGYRMIDGIPEFHYELGGSDVHERIAMAPDGKGLVRTFRIGGLRTAPVRFYTEPDAGVLYQASAGRWDGHVLQLTTQEAREFTLTMTELPRKEPLGYWSMDNHIVFKETPVPGVVNRALDFQRQNYHSSVIETRIDTNQLQSGATLTAWIRPTYRDRTDQTIFGAQNGIDNQLWFGYHGDGRGLTLVKKTQGIGGKLSAGNRLDDRWHFVAAIVAPDYLAIFLNGKEVARGAAKPITLATARLHIGSIAHESQYYGLLDELRVFDRILDADEIAAIHRRERDQLENRAR